MNTLKPWEQSLTTHTQTGQTIVTRDYSVNQVTISPMSEAEIVPDHEEEIKIEEIKSKSKKNKQEEDK